MESISGGVCAAKGFKAYGVHCGIRKNKTKEDLALVVADCPCSAAAVYTTNKGRAHYRHPRSSCGRQGAGYCMQQRQRQYLQRRRRG